MCHRYALAGHQKRERLNGYVHCRPRVNTNDKDGEINSAKVYFGNSDQQWWIAGSQQEHGLTLLAASPLATNLEFEPDRSKKYMKAVGIVHILMVSHQKFMQATMGQVL